MKMQAQQIELLAHTIIKRLVESGHVTVATPDEAGERISRLIADDLQVEDKLNEEVRELLSKHEGQMRLQGVQYHEMFKIVKQKLVRERKLII